MENGEQETSVTTEKLTLESPNLSQSEWEQLREGKEVVREKSAPEVKTLGETADDSDTSKLEAKEVEGDDDEVESSEDEATEAVKPKKKSGTQRRIEKLVKQRAEAEREREYWREQALKAQGKTEQAKPDVKAQATEGRPNANDFESHEDYILALADWRADEKIKAAKESERQEKLKAEVESKKQTFQGKVHEFEKTHEDFQDVIADVDDVVMSIAVQQAILESDNGPELMYELAKNRDEYERICSLPSLQAAREIGRFEAKLLKAPEEKKPETKKTTKAPPPAKPINASSANGKKSIYDKDISFAEYDRLRREQEQRRGA